jgi:hypothetical protein
MQVGVILVIKVMVITLTHMEGKMLADLTERLPAF